MQQTIPTDMKASMYYHFLHQDMDTNKKMIIGNERQEKHQLIEPKIQTRNNQWDIAHVDNLNEKWKFE